MTIEELKAEWEEVKQYAHEWRSNERVASFAYYRMDNLLAVAEFAERAIEVGDYYAGPMIKAMDDLLGEKRDA